MTFEYRTQYLTYRRYIAELMRQVQTPVARASLAIVGSLLFSAFLLAVALRPTLLTVASLTRSIKDERRVVSALDEKIQTLQMAQQKLQEVQRHLGPAGVAIPDQVDLEGVVKEVELLAAEKGIRVFELQQSGFLVHSAAIPTPSVDQAPQASDISLALVVGGDEEPVRSFFRDLENLDRLVVVSSADFTSVPSEERKSNPYAVRASATIHVFTTQARVFDQPDEAPGAVPPREAEGVMP